MEDQKLVELELELVELELVVDLELVPKRTNLPLGRVVVEEVELVVVEVEEWNLLQVRKDCSNRKLLVEVGLVVAERREEKVERERRGTKIQIVRKSMIRGTELKVGNVR